MTLHARHALHCVCILVLPLMLAAMLCTAQDRDGALLFFDSFVNPNGCWSCPDAGSWGCDPSEGEFALWFDEPRSLGFALAPLAGPCPRSFVVSTIAYEYSSGGNAEYGIIWTPQDGSSLYQFLVSADGYYAVLQGGADGLQMPVSRRWSPHIRQGSSENHLRLIVIDDRATIEVNGEPLVTLDLELVGPYSVGIAGGNRDKPSAEIRFTEFSVREASEEDASAMMMPPAGIDSTLPFYDDFTDAGSGWKPLETEAGGREYGEGVFRIWLSNRRKLLCGWAPLAGPCPDSFAVEVTGYKHLGADDAEYGIVWGLDSDNLYIARITADGYYTISYQRDGVWQEPLIALEYSPHILRGLLRNAIRLVVTDTQAELLVNGESLSIIDLELEGPYDVGIIGGSHDNAPVEVRFADFSVKELTQNSGQQIAELKSKLGGDLQVDGIITLTVPFFDMLAGDIAKSIEGQAKLRLDAAGIPFDVQYDFALTALPGQPCELTILASGIASVSGTALELEWTMSGRGPIEFTQFPNADIGEVVGTCEGSAGSSGAMFTFTGASAFDGVVSQMNDGSVLIEVSFSLHGVFGTEPAGEQEEASSTPEQAGDAADACAGFDARISTDKASYAIGEHIVIAIELNRESEVVVYDHATDGNSYAVFGSSLEAGTYDLAQLLSVPGITVTGPPGVETLEIVATSDAGCTISSKTIIRGTSIKT